MSNDYRNVSGHPEDLEGGRMVGTGEVFKMTKEELASDFNQAKINEGTFLEISTTKNKEGDK